LELSFQRQAYGFVTGNFTSALGDFMYTAQIDRHGNIIVCRGDLERSGYVIFFTGTYTQCINRKFRKDRAYA